MSNNTQSLSYDNCIYQKKELKIDVSFSIYIIAFMSFISWFIFVLYGGIGLAAVPLDLIYDFCSRPKRLSLLEIDRHREKVLNSISGLKELAQEVRALESRGARQKGCNYFFN
jgi:LMBR1 domain-containing protein 1